MILHLLNSEKVVERVVNLFNEALPLNNIFLIKRNGTYKIPETPNVLVFEKIDELRTIDTSSVKVVIIHYLDEWKIDFLNTAKLKNVRVYWSIWGADMYNYLLEPLGYNIYANPWKMGVFYLPKLFNRIRCRLGIIPSNRRKYIKFIKYHVSCLKTSSEEYSIQKKYLGNNLTESYIEHPYNIYYTLEDILGESLMKSSVCGNDIMIGNSASYSNNHFYAFKALSKFNIEGRKVICPLSYGTNNYYKRKIVTSGIQSFGINFRPLLDFMSLDSYNQVMLNCSIFIYANWRQEAVGNILVALYLGAKVFLSKESPLLYKFKREGLIVFCLEDITQYDIDTPLTLTERSNNKAILCRMISHNAIIKGIRNVWGNKVDY